MHYSLSRLNKLYILISLLLLFCVDVNAADQLTTPSNAIEVSDYFKVLLGLIFVIALFLVSSFLYKRYANGPMSGRGQLRVVDGLYLGNRERLVLIELNSKQVLLAITPGRINILDTVDVLSSEEVSSDPALEVVHPSTPANKSQAAEVTNA